jgi:hypothetical protein
MAPIPRAEAALTWHGVDMYHYYLVTDLEMDDAGVMGRAMTTQLDHIEEVTADRNDWHWARDRHRRNLGVASDDAVAASSGALGTNPVFDQVWMNHYGEHFSNPARGGSDTPYSSRHESPRELQPGNHAVGSAAMIRGVGSEFPTQELDNAGGGVFYYPELEDGNFLVVESQSVLGVHQDAMVAENASPGNPLHPRTRLNGEYRQALSLMEAEVDGIERIIWGDRDARDGYPSSSSSTPSSLFSQDGSVVYVYLHTDSSRNLPNIVFHQVRAETKGRGIDSDR